MTRSSFSSRLVAALPGGVVEAPFIAFRDDLLRFNRGRNLVSRQGTRALVEDLILECVVAAGVLGPRPGRTLDLGSGAGFPGIPFALVHSSCPVLLIDRRTAACQFLRREVAALALTAVEVEEGPSEEILRRRPELRGGFEWGLLKAVAPPAKALALVFPFLAKGARCALFREEGFRPGPEIDMGLWEWEGPRPLAEGGASRRSVQLFRKRISG